MKDLLLEFLGSILLERQTYKLVKIDAAGGERVVTFTRKDSFEEKGRTPNYRPFDPKKDASLQTQLDTDDTLQVKGSNPVKVSPAGAKSAKSSKVAPEPKTKKTAKIKITPTPSTRTAVESIFGHTKLDLSGLLNAVEGAEPDKGDIGAGTPASVAGEAATTLGMEFMKNLRKDNKNLTTEEFLATYAQPEGPLVELLSRLMGLPGKPKNMLAEDWAVCARNQVIASFHMIENRFGQEVQDIAWDNKSGRDAFGLGPKPSTDRSDYYVRTKQGEIIGISLKKDGNVFLANNGLAKMLKMISESTNDPSAKNKIMEIAQFHTEHGKTQYKHLLALSLHNQKEMRSLLSTLVRKDVPDVSSPKYGQFFDAKTGKLNAQTIDMLVSGGIGSGRGKTKPYSGDEQKFFLRVMGGVVKKTEKGSHLRSNIEKHLIGIRDGDGASTERLLNLVSNDESVNKAITHYLIDALDLIQLTTKNKPFGEQSPINRVGIAYGLASVGPDGEEFPMAVTGETIVKALDLPENMNQEQLESIIRDKFIVDVDDVGAVGFLRLRIKNNTPPPPYFYPSISTLVVRSRGLLTPPSMELSQHSGWTNTLLYNTADPTKWPIRAKVSQINDTIAFLQRQLQSGVLGSKSKEMERRKNIEKEIEYYSTLIQKK